MKKSKVLKFTGQKETDNIETHEGLNEVIKTWLESISMPFEGHSSPSIENFEFRSRDGFSAFSHNRGGLDLFHITDIASLIGSGEHSGLDIQEWADSQWDNTRNDLIKDNPEMDHESDEFFDLVYQCCSDDYSAVAWRIRVMYEGNGVLKIYAKYDKDAPYFRFQGETLLDAEIKFKTLSGLERQLARLTKKVEESQNETQKN